MNAINGLVRKMRELAREVERAAARHAREHSDDAERALLDLELELTLVQTEARLALEQSGGLPCGRLGHC
ncbi:MAG: hypothetical protein ACK4N5_19165 [Myxococcales bacterium]